MQVLIRFSRKKSRQHGRNTSSVASQAELGSFSRPLRKNSFVFPPCSSQPRCRRKRTSPPCLPRGHEVSRFNCQAGPPVAASLRRRGFCFLSVDHLRGKPVQIRNTNNKDACASRFRITLPNTRDTGPRKVAQQIMRAYIPDIDHMADLFLPSMLNNITDRRGARGKWRAWL